MKKIFTQLAVGVALIGGMTLSVSNATAQQASVASGLQFSEAPALREASQLRATLKPLKTTEYVATDINGKKHDINAILKSGKAIMIDFSAVWCGPCWQLHNSGVLERLYTKFGPEGTNQIELFWVGCDESSTVNAIKGKGGKSPGDWTKDKAGKPVPYPIFSDPRMHATLGIPIPGVPTLALVGPDGRYVECRAEVQTSDSQFKKFSELLALFLTEKDKPAGVHFSGPTDLYVGETQMIKVAYQTVAPVTSIKWEAPEGITLTKVSDAEYKVSSQTVGTYEIVATVANKNGEAKGTVTVTVSDHISKFPFFSSMDVKDKLDKGWRSIDRDGDGFGFDSYMGKAFMERLGLKFNNPNIKIGAENSQDCLVSFGTFFPTEYNEQSFNGEDINPDNELISAPLVIPADAKAPTFSCYINLFFNDPKSDQLKVMVSELGGEPVELLAPQTPKSGDVWTLISADLSAYKGKTIMLSLVPVVNGASAILVDQIRVTMDGSTDVEMPSLNVQTTLYPNPASEFITVHTRIGSTIELFTIDGAVVYATQAESESTTVAVAQLPAGRYIARVTSVDGEVVLRPVIIR